MTTAESPYKEQIITQETLKTGSLFFTEKILVTEFSLGAHINFDNFYTAALKVQEFYKGKDFGIIANRINSYSLDLNDAPLFNEVFPNCKAYAIVNYNPATDKIIEVENQFFPLNRNIFRTLPEALNWVDQVLSQSS